MKKKIFNILVVGLAICFNTAAQTEGYRYKAPVAGIDKSGFYEIVLSPATTALLKTDYTDLRIINAKNKWVPHLLRVPATEFISHPVLFDQPIVYNNSSNSLTEIVIKTAGKKISDLYFEIKNSGIERFGTLTGSDDSTRWFIINDSIQLRPIQNQEPAKSTLAIQFPPTDYRFYKLVIGNGGTAPYNILGISASEIPVEDSTLKEFFLENPTAIISQKDSGKYSIVTITQKGPFHVDKIALKITGTKYFLRRVDLYLPEAKSKYNSSHRRLMQSFSISNNSDLQFRMPETLDTDSFFLLIHNEDNLPLTLGEVKTFSYYRTVVAYLEKGEAYQMILGNENAVAPVYDLNELRLNFKESLQEATIGTISATAGTKANTASSSNNKMTMWLLIAAAAIVLGFFSYKLMTEMNKKEKT